MTFFPRCCRAGFAGREIVAKEQVIDLTSMFPTAVCGTWQANGFVLSIDGPCGVR